MMTSKRALLRVYLRNTDKSGFITTAQAVIDAARSSGLAGGTVLRGIYGLDLSGAILHTSRWALVEHLPVVVELMDTRGAIAAFLPTLGALVADGLATLEDTQVLARRGASTGDGGANQTTRASDPSKESQAMNPKNGRLARIFIDEADVWQGRPLYQVIIEKAKELGVASAAVFRASMGFGTHRRVHAANLVDVSADSPLVIEIVDSAEQINALLPFLEVCVAEGLVTLEAVEILRLRAGTIEVG